MKFNKDLIGSDFDDFLHKEGFFKGVEAGAVKQVVACMIEYAIAENHLTKAEMARRIGISQMQLDRLLDPEDQSVTLSTSVKAAIDLMASE